MSKTYPLLFSLLLALPACGAAESEDGSAGESGQALASGTHWVTHRVHLNQATHVDLANLGAHTHSNWVTWQLPYNLTYMTNHPDQFNRIFFTPHSDTNTDVGAAREPNTKICIPLPDSGHGPIVAWGRDTAAGAGGQIGRAHV